MKTKKTVSVLLIAFIMTSCAPMAKIAPTPSETAVLSTSTFTPVPPTITNTSTSTPRPTKTPIPIVYVTLGELFSQECANGNPPRIWANDSFNWSGLHSFDDHHGHVDIRLPDGCQAWNIRGEVLAPVPGEIVFIRDTIDEGYPNKIYDLVLPPNTYIEGIEKALVFAGVSNPNLSNVSNLRINFGHIDIPSDLHRVSKGDTLGDVIDLPGKRNTIAIAYQIMLNYKGEQYMLSPTLFSQDGPSWVCVPGSPYDCEPKSKDFVE